MDPGKQRAPDAPSSLPKRTILNLLKRSPNAPLADVAAALGISRTGALKHLSKLEGQGLLAREYRPGRRGRPRVYFRLTSAAQAIFPAVYSETALSAMAFIEKHQGRRAVTAMLEGRAAELREKHAPRLAGKPLRKRVEELARIRDEEGYMAEVQSRRSSDLVLLEHNCPILAIAEKYGEACDVERRLFRSLLGTDVLVSHRVVAGDPVCRFLVRVPPNPP